MHCCPADLAAHCTYFRQLFLGAEAAEPVRPSPIWQCSPLCNSSLLLQACTRPSVRIKTSGWPQDSSQSLWC